MVKAKSLLFLGLTVFVPIQAIADDEYKKITDQAYCVGVYREILESSPRTPQFDELAIQSYRNKHSKAKSDVEGAIQRGSFDLRSQHALASIGYADSMSCSRDRLSVYCDLIKVCE